MNSLRKTCSVVPVMKIINRFSFVDHQTVLLMLQQVSSEEFPILDKYVNFVILLKSFVIAIYWCHCDVLLSKLVIYGSTLTVTGGCYWCNSKLPHIYAHWNSKKHLAKNVLKALHDNIPELFKFVFRQLSVEHFRSGFMVDWCKLKCACFSIATIAVCCNESQAI